MSFYEIVLTLHIVSAAVGVGAAATSDSIFLNSIRNRIISHDQFILIKAASRVVMGGLTHLDKQLSEELIASKQWLFAITGAVSGVSWFTALIVAVVGHVGIVGLTYLALAGIYVLLISAGAVAGYFLLAHLIFWSDVVMPEKKPAKKKPGLILQILLLVVLILSILIIYVGKI
jgi:hypothetical protein